MALVTGDINWKGYGKVTDADTTTGFGVIKTTSGGGTPSVALADGGLQGVSAAQAITTTSNNKRILLYYDIGSGNELDFSGGGTEEGEFVWVWGNFLASSLLELASANGFGIMLGSGAGTISWSLWTFFGSDNYAGGWKRMVIDPTKTASLTGSGSSEGGGGVSLSAVRYFGIHAKTTNTARFDNMLVDRMDVGTGYSIDGTGATADSFFSDLLAVEQTTANWWGVVKSLNDSDSALSLVGELDIGDNVGTTATTITDIDSKIFCEEPLYYNAGFVAALPLTATKINFVGNGTGATSITIGKPVGTIGGRSGWTIVGNDTYDIGIDFDDGNVNTCEVYGSTFANLTGTISWGTNTSHKGFTLTFNECEQFDPVGGVQLKDLILSNYVGTDGALLWNASINMVDSQFINVDRGVEITQTVNQTFNGLIFDDEAGNFDVHLNNGGTSIEVAKTGGANPNSYTATTGGVVTFTASFTLTLTDIPSGVNVTIVNSSTRAELQHSTSTGTNITYSHSGGETVDILLMSNTYDPNLSDIYDLTLDNASQSIKFQLIDDPNYDNP